MRVGREPEVKPVNQSRSGLYLVEFVIVLLFFSVASTIVFQFFIKGSGMSSEAYDLNRAVVRAESITEKVLASGGEDALLSETFIKTADGYALYFDEDWKETGAGYEKFTADIRVSVAGSMLVSDVAVKKGAQELFSIHSKRYMGLKGE
jgi:hypothetical protein